MSSFQTKEEWLKMSWPNGNVNDPCWEDSYEKEKKEFMSNHEEPKELTEEARNAKEREEGYYWVKDKYIWRVAKWDMYWFLTGSSMAFPYNWFKEMGNKIKAPQ